MRIKRITENEIQNPTWKMHSTHLNFGCGFYHQFQSLLQVIFDQRLVFVLTASDENSITKACLSQYKLINRWLYRCTTKTTIFQPIFTRTVINHMMTIVDHNTDHSSTTTTTLVHWNQKIKFYLQFYGH